MNYLKIFGIGLIGISFDAVAGKDAFNPNARPNILLILADDMGYSDIGCYGSEIATPNLDRLAQNGIKFSQFYNAARCCPTRASLLTGLYQHQAGVGDMVNDLGVPSYQGYLNNTSVTIAEALKLNGYNTYMSGKWHVGSSNETLPRQRGFDRYFGLVDGASSYFESIPYRINQKATRLMLDDADYKPSAGFYMTNTITDYALDFLDEEKPKSEPFFMYLAYTAPHWPLHALPKDIAKYRGKYLAGWDVLRKERFDKIQKLGLLSSDIKLSPRDPRSPDWNSLSDQEKKMWDLRMAVYAAMVDRLDQNIGRILSKLQEMGELNNTLIIFLADNGGCHEEIKNQGNYIRTTGETGTKDSFDSYEFPWANVSNTPFRMYKHWVNEGGISTPFIATYPNKIKGGKLDNRTPGHIIDLMPTFLELAGGRYPETYKGNKITPMEGTSLTPALTGKKLHREKPLFWEHEGNRAMRSGDWKIVSQYNEKERKFGPWELYDLKKDRSELKDLSSVEPELKARLVSEYEQWANRVGVVAKEQLDKKRPARGE